jgi:MscS family membrane protein
MISVRAFQQENTTPNLEEKSQIEIKVQIDTTNNLLKPPDASSPRKALMSFIQSMNRSYRILMKAHEKNLNHSGIRFAPEVKSDLNQAELIFDRAYYCLDMSSFPPSVQKDIGYGRALMLKEILDRIKLPTLTEVPGEKEIQHDLESKKYPTLLKWKIPNTKIVLVRQNEGQYQGEYLFSAETVKHIPEFYQKVKHLPYADDRFVTSGFYDFYRNTPGLLLPPKWSKYLPEWSTAVWRSQTIWQWIAMLICSLMSILLIRILYIFLIKKFKKDPIVKRKWFKVLFYLLTDIILIYYYKVLSQDVNLTGDVLVYTRLILEGLSWTLISLLVFHLFVAISETIIVAPKVDKMGIESAYTRAVMGVLAILAAATSLVIGLSQIGVSIIPLITGVGIGGIAIALAARSTIESIISSFTIFADKPYRVGDRVKVLGYDGTVENIGIRSTRLRLLKGSLTSIPNDKIASAEIENIQHRPFLRRTLEINIPYSTSGEKTNRAVEIIRNILAPRDTSDEDSQVNVGGENRSYSNKSINQPNYPPRVYFKDIQSDSLVIELNYWYHPPNWWDYMEHAHWVNVQILESFDKEGIEIAMPSHKIHLADNDNFPLSSGMIKPGS